MKLKASTIIESITAMVIIGIVFSIGMMVFGSMLNLNPGPQKIRAKLAIDEILQQTKLQQIFVDEVIEGKGFTISKSVKLYQGYEQIYEISLKAYDLKEKEFLSVRELVYSLESD